MRRGWHPLVVGEDTGSVAFPPEFKRGAQSAVLTVASPTGEQNIFATLTGLSEDAFTFSLSAAPDASGYILHYTIGN